MDESSSEISAPSPSHELIFKFLLIGDAGVGKTSILQKFTANEFSEEYQVTVGVEFGSKTIEIDESTKVKLQIWDTAGQESFSTVVKSFYRSAQCIFLVYNVKERQTFINLRHWLDEIAENSDPNVIRILIGNQVDGIREVEYEEGIDFMKDNGIHFFFETSALQGTNIESAFVEAAKLTFLFYMRDRKAGRESLFSGRKKSSVNLTYDRTSTQPTTQSTCPC